MREAIRQGHKVTFEIVSEFEYIDENDRKRRERDTILEIEERLRLNVQIPRPTDEPSRARVS